MGQNNTKSSITKLCIGVLALQLIQQTSFAMTPALASFAKYWPDIDYSWIMMLQTLGYIAIIPSSIWSGAVAGSKVRYRTLAIWSLLLVLIGGVFPYFYHENFWVVLATRVVCGIGIGLTFTIGSAVITALFKGKMRGVMQGVATIVLTCSGIVYQYVSGIVCVKNVHYVWLVHLFLIIPLVLVILFLREPTKEELSDAVEEGCNISSKPDFSWRAILIPFGFGLFMIFPYCVVLNMSSVIDYMGMGADVAGTVGIFYTIGGLAAGVLVGPMYSIFKKFAMSAAMIILFIGLALCGWGTTPFMMGVSEFFIGLGTFTIYPICIRDTNALVSPKGLMLCGGFFAATWNAGAFVSGPFISTINKTVSEVPMVPLRYALICAIVFGIVWTVVRAMRPKQLEEPGLYAVK